MGLTTDHGRNKSRRPRSKRDPFPPIEGPPTSGQTIADGRSDALDTDGGDSGEREADHEESELRDDPLVRPHALQRALRDVEAEIDAEHVRLQGRIDETRDEEEQLQDRLEQLYLELGSLQDSLIATSRAMRESLDERGDLERRRAELQTRALARTVMADAEALRERAEAWASRQSAAETRVRAFKENPDLAEQIADFRRLDERLDTLELLPESYRAMVRQRHSELKDKLRPHLEEPRFEAPSALHLAVAVAIEVSDDDPSRVRKLLAVLPVDFATHQRAREGKTDLTARFAFRVLAALSRFVVNIGARTDPRPTDLGSLLGLELPFDDLDLSLSHIDLARALRESFLSAHDPQMAKVNVFTDMVFVSTGAVLRLWRQAQAGQAPATPVRGAKRDGGPDRA